MKKRSLALLLALLLVFAVSACKPSATAPSQAQSQSQVPASGQSGSNDDPVTINLWHIYISDTDPNRVATEQFIEEYTIVHPNVKVEQHILQDADYKTKILTEFSGSASNIDVFAYWGAGRAGDLVDAGKLLCVEDYLSSDQLSGIKHGADNNFRYDGKLYGLPLASWMMVLYCNTDLFERNDIKLPDTYEEWLDACKKFAAAGVIPVALGGGVDDGWQAAFVYEALANRIAGAAEEMAVLNTMRGFSDNPGFADAASRVLEMNAAGAFGSSPLEIDEVTSNVQFLTGAAAMRLTGSWFTSGIYTEEDSVIAGKVKGLPIPAVNSGNGKATDYVGGFIDGYFVNKATKNPEVAADFAFGLSLALATSQHEMGEGFTAYDAPVDESGLTQLGKEIADMASGMVDGVVAWDTFLPGDLADVHIDACQSLLASRADMQSFLDKYKTVFN